jgi:hypothetical protein
MLLLSVLIVMLIVMFAIECILVLTPPIPILTYSSYTYTYTYLLILYLYLYLLTPPIPTYYPLLLPLHLLLPLLTTELCWIESAAGELVRRGGRGGEERGLFFDSGFGVGGW